MSMFLDIFAALVALGIAAAWVLSRDNHERVPKSLLSRQRL
jgi:hypothetical protein